MHAFGVNLKARGEFGTLYINTHRVHGSFELWMTPQEGTSGN